MFEEKLIKNVKKFPCIYNRMEVGYKNKMIREEAWESIAASLGSNVDRCRKRWRTLKDRFVKDFNKEAASGSEATPKKTQWKYSAAMSFMKDYVAPRLTSSSLDINISLEETASEEDFIDEVVSPIPLSCSSSPDQLGSASSTYRAAKRRAADEEHDPFFNIMGRLLNIAEEVIKRKRTDHEDDSGFCKFLMSILKKVDKSEQDRLTMDILNFANTEVNNILNKK